MDPLSSQFNTLSVQQSKETSQNEHGINVHRLSKLIFQISELSQSNDGGEASKAVREKQIKLLDGEIKKLGKEIVQNDKISVSGLIGEVCAACAEFSANQTKSGEISLVPWWDTVWDLLYVEGSVHGLGGGESIGTPEEIKAAIDKHRNPSPSESDKKKWGDLYSNQRALTKNFIETRYQKLVAEYQREHGKQPDPATQIKFKEAATREAYVQQLPKNIKDGFYNPKIIPFEMLSVLDLKAEHKSVATLDQAIAEIQQELNELCEKGHINKRQKESIVGDVTNAMKYYIDAFNSKDASGALATKALILGRDMARIAVYQEKFDKAAFTGSDHGSKHIHHNIEFALNIIEEMTKIRLTSKDKLLIYLVHFYHDTGYSPGLSAFSFDGMKDHPLVGAKMIEEHAAYFINLLDKKSFELLEECVLFHAIMQPSLKEEEGVEDLHPGLVRAISSISDACAVSWDRKTQEFWEQPSAVLELARLKLLLMIYPDKFKSMMSPDDYFKSPEEIQNNIDRSSKLVADLEGSLKAKKTEYSTAYMGKTKLEEEIKDLESTIKKEKGQLETLHKQLTARQKDWGDSEYMFIRNSFIKIKSNLTQLIDTNPALDEDKRLAFKGAVNAQLNSLTSKITLGQYGSVLHKLGAKLMDGKTIQYKPVAYMAPSLIYGVLEDLFGADQAGEAFGKIAEEFRADKREIGDKVMQMSQELVEGRKAFNLSRFPNSSTLDPESTQYTISGQFGDVVVQSEFDIANKTHVWDISGENQISLLPLQAELKALHLRSIRGHIKELFKNVDDLCKGKISYEQFGQKQNVFIATLKSGVFDLNVEMLDIVDDVLKETNEKIDDWIKAQQTLDASFKSIEERHEPNELVKKLQNAYVQEISDAYKTGGLSEATLKLAKTNFVNKLTPLILAVDEKENNTIKANILVRINSVEASVKNSLELLKAESSSLNKLKNKLNSTVRTKSEIDFIESH